MDAVGGHFDEVAPQLGHGFEQVQVVLEDGAVGVVAAAQQVVEEAGDEALFGGCGWAHHVPRDQQHEQVKGEGVHFG